MFNGGTTAVRFAVPRLDGNVPAELVGASEEVTILAPRSSSEKSDFMRRIRDKFTEPSSPTSVDLDSECDVQESGLDFSEEETIRDKVEPKEHRSETCTITWDVAKWPVVFFLIVVAVVLKRSFWMPSANGDRPNVDAQIARLQESFPGQSARLWGVLKIAIATGMRFSAPPKNNGGVDNSPKVLLISPSAEPAKYDKYRKFLERFEDSLSSLGHMGKCVDIDPFLSPDSTSPDEIKRSIYNQMQDAYRSGHRCLHVVGIDRLPGEAALSLHGITDPLHSPFRAAFLLLSIDRPPKFPNGTSQRDMETHLRRYLLFLWEKDLGGDEAYALLNRLTARVGIFEV
ncbi:hypothetical protein Aperf_G00000051615 [Anoplocephala perfoliata]